MMANDKDFVVNGPVAIGKDTKVTVGDITSSDIDLATGNYFDDTLAANTTYTLSNAGDVQAFQLEVTGGADGPPSLLTASYDAKTFSVVTQDSSANGLFFKADGLAMYVSGGGNDTVFQYTLSTAWDVSTASYASKSFDHSSQTTQCSGLSFRPDGTKMYILRNGASDLIYQYTLSTAWDVSTAAYDSKSLNVAGQDTAPQGIAFKPDGTRLYLLGNSDNDLNEYTLSTNWDISSASYLQTASVSTLSTTPMDLGFSSDGTVVFIADGDDDAIHSFNLSTAWDISTLTAVGSFPTFVDLNNTTMAFALGGDDHFYHVSQIEDTVYQYSFNRSTTITWPTSIEWAGGIAPAAPANGETDVYTFTTDDGGTAYTGVKSIDNAS